MTTSTQVQEARFSALKSSPSVANVSETIRCGSGAGAVSDVYVICFSIPTVIFAGLGTAIMTGYISVYSELEVNNPRRLQQFHNSTTSLILLISAAIVGVFQAFAEPLTKIFAIGFDESTLAFAVSLARIMVVSLLFIAFSYMLQGYLQMKGSFSLSM